MFEYGDRHGLKGWNMIISGGQEENVACWTKNFYTFGDTLNFSISISSAVILLVCTYILSSVDEFQSDDMFLVKDRIV